MEKTSTNLKRWANKLSGWKLDADNHQRRERNELRQACDSKNLVNKRDGRAKFTNVEIFFNT